MKMHPSVRGVLEQYPFQHKISGRYIVDNDGYVLSVYTKDRWVPQDIYNPIFTHFESLSDPNVWQPELIRHVGSAVQCRPLNDGQCPSPHIAGPFNDISEWGRIGRKWGVRI